MKLLEFLQGTTGDLSSKRLAGVICIIQGCLMKGALFSFSFFKVPAVEFSRLDSCADSLFIIGGTMLGAGLVELFSKTKKK